MKNIISNNLNISKMKRNAYQDKKDKYINK